MWKAFKNLRFLLHFHSVKCIVPASLNPIISHDCSIEFITFVLKMTLDLFSRSRNFLIKRVPLEEVSSSTEYKKLRINCIEWDQAILYGLGEIQFPHWLFFMVV